MESRTLGDYFNPLNHVIGRERPHTYEQKARDTFEFWAGYPFDNMEVPIENKPLHFGIFDYLTLGIPTILLTINLELIRKSNNRAVTVLLCIAFALTSAPLLLARAIFAGVLTFACLLPILFAQCADSPEELPEEIEKIVEVKAEKRAEEMVAQKTEEIAAKADKQIKEKEIEDGNLRKKVNDFFIKKKGKRVETVLTEAGTSLDKIDNIQDEPTKKTATHHRLHFFKPGSKQEIVKFKLKLEEPAHKEVHDALLKMGKIKSK